MKINLQQPKYVLPLIVLPFILLFNFMYLEFVPPEEESTNLEEKEGIITSIPKPNMEKLKIDDKLSNMRKDFKEYKDLSALEDELVEDKDIKSNLNESVYNKKEAEELLQLQDSLKRLKEIQKLDTETQSYFGQNKNIDYSQKERNDFNSYQNQRAALQQEQELNPREEFLKEMRQIDSVINPEKYKKRDLENTKELQLRKPEKIYQVKNIAATNSKYFNTVSAKQTEEIKVEGLLDEKIKVSQGSRVRIKLASDIMIDSIPLEKHQYIFGTVTGFGPQRLYITITNIMVRGKIFDVNLSVYDLDGMKGFYVPSSKFREFTKELGGQTADNIGQGVEQQSGAPSTGQEDKKSFFIDLATSIARATTQTAGQIIRKNRAHLKYNTKVYLINEKKN